MNRLKSSKPTEGETVALFNAVLENKEVLESKSRMKDDLVAREEKWKELASQLFVGGKIINFKQLRKLYGSLKSAAKMKYRSVHSTRNAETRFVPVLSEAEDILRQICPELFPQIAGRCEDANREKTRAETLTKQRKNGPTLDKSPLAKNTIDVASKPDVIVEPKSSSQNPQNDENIDREMLALSLEAVEDAAPASPISQVEHDLGIEKLIDNSEIKEKLTSGPYDGPQLHSENEKSSAIEESAVEKIINNEMETTENDEMVSHKEFESTTDNDPSKSSIENLDSTTTEDQDNPYPEFPAFDLTTKRKKNPRQTQRKKRKVNKSK